MKKSIIVLGLILSLSVIFYGSNPAISARGNSGSDSKVKIGFIVKLPESDWFQSEWRYAKKAAEEYGFTIVPLAGENGEKLMAAVDSLASQQADGIIVCVPNPKMGQALVKKVNGYGMKLMTVDDRLIDNSGNPITEVHHMGISAYNIGQQVGEMIWKEIGKRNWNPSEVGAIMMSIRELETGQQRVDGATDKLIELGFPKGNFIEGPTPTGTPDEGVTAANTIIAKSPQFKKWVAFGLNDEVVVGAVRASENNGITAKDFIGVGIGGYSIAKGEFDKSSPSGFFGTIVLSPFRHGYETAVNMYQWIKDGKEPDRNIATDGYPATKETYADVYQKVNG